DRGPRRLEQVLQPCLPPRYRPDVLEQPQLAVVAQHPMDLADGDVRPDYRAEDEPSHDGVEGAVAEGQRLGARAHEPGARFALARPAQGIGGEIDADHPRPRGKQRYVPTRPAAGAERQSPCAAGRPPSPASEP